MMYQEATICVAMDEKLETSGGGTLYLNTPNCSRYRSMLYFVYKNNAPKYHVNQQIQWRMI